MAREVKFATFNMHGWRQGLPSLTELCLSCDVIFLQEHWLTSSDCHKLNVNDDFVLFFSSAMDSVVSAGVLKGRPFGGVCILIRKQLACYAKLLCKAERFIILKLDDMLLCNVYMPCKSVPKFAEIYASTLSDIINVVQSESFQLAVFGGDFNSTLGGTCESVNLVHDFCTILALRCVKYLLPPHESYSFMNSRGDTSLIDHFLISVQNLSDIVSVNIVESGLNMSDHLPVVVSISCRFGNQNASDSGSNNSKASLPHLTDRLRWDKGNLGLYYDTTFRELNHLNYISSSICNNYLSRPAAQAVIESQYSAIVNALKNAASLSIPKKAFNFFKFWWDGELDDAKHKSIQAHKMWVINGKPKCGTLFRTMTQCRGQYKLLIKTKEMNSKNCFSNELSDSLQYKSSDEFWKCWRSKMGAKRCSKVIEGELEAPKIAGRFASFFEGVCISNSLTKHVAFENKFISMFNTYSGSASPSVLTVDMVGRCISSMKVGKAAGCDGLTVEHLTHSHPFLVSLVTDLFNACIETEYVPNDFGRGILVPLLKSNDLDSTKVDNYRGITLSCVLSKLFEFCLLKLFADYLETSDLQLGFKKGVGCSDAILTARNAVNYLVDRGSTAVICTLDISKAFDRVDHYCLYLKLMEKHVPRNFIALIAAWYSKCYVQVRWGNVLSDPFTVKAGVRQGGILSPFLFAVYIDSLIHKLKCSGHGLYICNVFLGCLLYADDVFLISHCVCVMQKMLDICSCVAEELDMRFNASKSFAMRVGIRCNVFCAPLYLDGSVVNYSREVKYLGVCLKAGLRLTGSYLHNKMSFYRAFNALYSKIKAANSELICVYLLKTMCMPIVTYALEAMCPCNSDLRMMDKLIDNAVRKIFNIVDSHNVTFVKQVMGLCDTCVTYRSRACNFLSKFAAKPFVFADIIFNLAFMECNGWIRQYCSDASLPRRVQMRHALAVVRAV